MHARHMLVQLFLPLAVVSVALEAGWYILVQKRSYPWREMLASVGVRVLHLPMRFLTPMLVTPVALLVWNHRIANVPLTTGWGVGLLFLGEEFAYYWAHRAGHEVRWMWATHVVHHTPHNIHFASALRTGATTVISGEWLFRLPLYFLGLNPLAVAGMQALNLTYQFFLHTDLVGRLGPLEWALNTPSHHRVHHASNREYLDRNYGGILIVWDRLFNTFAREDPGIPIVYGLVHPIGSLNPVTILSHEWRAIMRDATRAGSGRDLLRQCFGRPGAALESAQHPAAAE